MGNLIHMTETAAFKDREEAKACANDFKEAARKIAHEVIPGLVVDFGPDMKIVFGKVAEVIQEKDWDEKLQYAMFTQIIGIYAEEIDGEFLKEWEEEDANTI